jgi:phosphonate transport system permease protein
MGSAVNLLPASQLEPLRRGYRRAVSARRASTLLFFACLAITVLGAAKVTEIDPALLWAHRWDLLDYFNRCLLLDSGERVWSHPFGHDGWLWNLSNWLSLLLETIVMSYVGTLLGGTVGFVLCFVASANLTTGPWLRGAARRLLEFLRTVPDLVFALIFVEAFGLGPLPGVLALALHSTGALGKLFYELVENIDMKPVDGVRAAGGGRLSTARFAVMPQVMAGFASYLILRFEINVREAAVLGYVGAGGIGYKLVEAIRKFYYSDVSAIIMLVIVTVFAIEMGTGVLRRRLLGDEARA